MTDYSALLKKSFEEEVEDPMGGTKPVADVRPKADYAKLLATQPVSSDVQSHSGIGSVVSDIGSAVSDIGAAAMDLVTGESKATEETKTYPDFNHMPEMSTLTWPAIKNMLGTILADPEETAKTIATNSPGVEVSRDSKGNIILESPMAKEMGFKHTKFIIRPGLQESDIPSILAGTIYSVADKGKGLLKKMLIGGAVQTGVEASQAALGGDFDAGQIPLTMATEGASRVVGKIPEVVRGFRAPPSAAQKLVGEAEKAGIPVFTGDIKTPKTYMGKALRTTSERLPVIGTARKRMAQQRKRVDAIRNTLAEYGADVEARASDDVLDDLFKQRENFINKYAGMKTEVIDRLTSNVMVNVDRTSKTIGEEIAKLKSLRTKDSQKAIDVFLEYDDALQKNNLGNIEELRKQLGKKLQDPDLATIRSTAEKSLSKIYGSLREDMGDFIKTVGEKKDFVKWKVANRRLSDSIEELKVNVLKRTLEKGEGTPEVVKSMLFSKKPSEVKLLNRNLSPAGRRSARAAILQEAADRSGGIDNLDPKKFIKNIDKLSTPFGVFFKGKDKEAARGLARALELTKRVEKAEIEPAMLGLAAISAPTVLSLIFGGSSAWGLGATVSLGAMAHAYESKPVRGLLLRLAKAKPGTEAPIIRALTSAIQTAQTKTKPLTKGKK